MGGAEAGEGCLEQEIGGHEARKERKEDLWWQMKRSSDLHYRALDSLVLGVLLKVYFCIALRGDNGQLFMIA